MHKIMKSFAEFGKSDVESIEKHFDVNIALVKMINQRSGISGKYFNFERKPSSWDNLVLIGQNENLFYIHLSRPEFLKKLSKKDSILQMKISSIFPGVENLTMDNIDELEKKFSIQIFDSEMNNLYGDFGEDKECVNLQISNPESIFTQEAQYCLIANQDLIKSYFSCGKCEMRFNTK